MNKLIILLMFVPLMFASTIELIANPVYTEVQAGKETLIALTVINNTNKIQDVYLQGINAGLGIRMSGSIFTIPPGAQIPVSLYVTPQKKGQYQVLILAKTVEGDYVARTTVTVNATESQQEIERTAVEISGPTGCTDLNSGELYVQDISITNLGPVGGDFRIRLDAGDLGVMLDNEAILNFQPNDTVVRKLYITPRNTGRKFVTVAVINKGIVVGRQIMCFDVRSTEKEKLDMNAQIMEKRDGSKLVGYEVKVRIFNNTPNAQIYKVKLENVPEDAMVVGETSGTVQPWENIEKTITIQTTKEAPIKVTVTTPEGKLIKEVPTAATGFFTVKESNTLVGAIVLVLAAVLAIKHKDKLKGVRKKVGHAIAGE